MKNKLKALIKKMPLVNSAVRIVLNAARNISFPGSKEYWEKLYSSGGTSGPGSYGKLAESKAGIINSFIKNNEINSVIDFGCGDGNQLSLFDFPSYIGLDVSSTAIKLCKKRFKDDKTKSFFLYDPERFENDNSSAACMFMSSPLQMLKLRKQSLR